VDAALEIAQTLCKPILAGEFAGSMPAGFEVNNSPAEFAYRTDTERPLVLVSSSGTKVIHEAAMCEAAYLACLRCDSALAAYLPNHHPHVALIGAGTKGEFREEDQMCCAWIASSLISRGYRAGSTLTTEVVERWRDAPPQACLCSRSVDFLQRTGQLRDLDFILSHIDDLDRVFEVRNGEVKVIQATARATGRTCTTSGISL
jgi:2-phosphosulfolactate phosphatase